MAKKPDLDRVRRARTGDDTVDRLMPGAPAGARQATKEILHLGGFDLSDYGAMVDALGLDPMRYDFAGYSERGKRFRQGANYRDPGNPYDLAAANQARGAQEALYAQMRAQQAGPSVAAMQGQQAMGQNMGAALGAASNPAQARAAMMQAGRAGAGLAGDLGQGRLSEQMALAQATAQHAGGVRGADMANAQQAAKSYGSAKQQELDRAQAYATLGQQLDQARSRAALENERLRYRLGAQQRKTNLGAMKNVAGGVGALFSSS